MFRFLAVLILVMSCVAGATLEELDLITEKPNIRLFDFNDVHFPSAFIMEKDFVTVSFRYFTGSEEMLNFDDSEKTHDADLVGNSFLWSYNLSRKINVYAALTTYYTNYSINKDATIVRDFDTTYRNILNSIDSRLLSIPTLAPVYEVDRRYWKRYYGINIELADFKEHNAKIMTGFTQYHQRYQRKDLTPPYTTASTALLLTGAIPRTIEDIVYAVENSEVRVFGSKRIKNLELHGGVKVTSTETKIDDEKAAFYKSSTLFGRFDYYYRDNFIFKMGFDTYGLMLDFNYFQDDDFIFSVFYQRNDDDIQGKSSITGYENVHFVRKEKTAGITYTKRF